jgi:tetratricopeptide (TPR) repeat protein
VDAFLFQIATKHGVTGMSVIPGTTLNLEIPMSRKRRSLLLALPLLLTGALSPQLSPVAQAQAAPASRSAESQMQHHYDSAFQLQNAGNLPQANSEYKLFLAIALHRIANGHANTGDYAHAAPLYDEAIRLAPDDRSVRIDYAGAALDASDWTKAKTLASQVLDQLQKDAQPPDPHTVSVLAQALLESGEHQAALEQFRIATQLHPGVDTSSALAAAYLVLGDHMNASKILDSMPEKFGDSAELRMKLGILYGKSKFFDEADQEFKKAIAKDDRLKGAHYSLGASYMMQSGEPSFNKAEAEYRKELALDPDNSLVYMPLGRIAMAQHRYEEAEADLKHAVLLNKQSASAYIALGQLYRETQRNPLAEAAYRRAIALTLDPSINGYEVEQAHYWLGKLLIQSGGSAEGRKELDISRNLLYLKEQRVEFRLAGDPALQAPLEKTHEANPEDLAAQKAFEKRVGPPIASSYDNLGVNAANAGDFVEASSYFQQAAKWNPSLSGIDEYWGRAAFAAKEYAEAVEPLSRTLALHSSDPHVRAMLGLSLCRVHQYGRAVQVLRPIEDKMDANPELTIAYAGSMAMEGEPGTDLTRLKSLEEANSEIPLVHYLLGEAYAANKNYGQAVDELRISLKQDPANAETKNALALTYQALGQKTEALQLLSDLAESRSKDGEVYYRVAQLQIELGSAKAAISTLQTAIRLNPIDAAYHQELAEAYRQNAQPADAERETQQSATLDALNAINHPSGSGN